MDELDSLFGSPRQLSLSLPGGPPAATFLQDVGLGHPTNGSSPRVENVGTIALPGLHSFIEPVITSSAPFTSTSSAQIRKRKRATSPSRDAEQPQARRTTRASTRASETPSTPHALLSPAASTSTRRLTRSRSSATPASTQPTRPPSPVPSQSTHAREPTASRTVLDRLQSNSDFLIVLRLLIANISQTRQALFPHRKPRLPGAAEPWSSQQDIEPAPGYITEPLKRRKLQRVPAGAQFWDVPYPFQPGEGPRDYESHWRSKRGELLVKALVRIVEDVLRDCKGDATWAPQQRDPLQTAEQNTPRPLLEKTAPIPAPAPAPADTDVASAVDRWLDSLPFGESTTSSTNLGLTTYPAHQGGPEAPLIPDPALPPPQDGDFFTRLFGDSNAMGLGDMGHMDMFQDLFRPSNQMDLSTSLNMPTTNGQTVMPPFGGQELPPLSGVDVAMNPFFFDVAAPQDQTGGNPFAVSTWNETTPELTQSASTSSAPTVIGTDDGTWAALLGLVQNNAPTLPCLFPDISAPGGEPVMDFNASGGAGVDAGTLESLVSMLLGPLPSVAGLGAQSSLMFPPLAPVWQQPPAPQPLASQVQPAEVTTRFRAWQPSNLAPVVSTGANAPTTAAPGKKRRKPAQRAAATVQEPEILPFAPTTSTVRVGTVAAPAAATDEWAAAVTTKVERKSALLERAAAHRARLQAEMDRVCEEMWGCTIEGSVVHHLKMAMGSQ